MITQLSAVCWTCEALPSRRLYGFQPLNTHKVSWSSVFRLSCSCVFIADSDLLLRKQPVWECDYIYTTLVHYMIREYKLKAIIEFSLATELLIAQVE